MEPRKPLPEIVVGPMASSISAVVALVAAIGFYVCAKTQSSEVTIELLATFNIGILCYIAFEHFMRIFILRDIHEVLKRTARLIEHIGMSCLLVDRLTLLSHENPLISYVGRDTVNAFLVNFGVTKDGKRLTLRGSDMTKAALIGFWQWAVELQKSSRRRSLIVRVTHSNGIGLYSDRNDPVTLQLYALQSEFIKNGGHIFRILIENASDTYHRRLNEYISVMHRMEEIGIVTVYISLDSCCDDEGLSRLNHDLLLIDPQQYSISWDRERDYTPRSCIISAEKSDYEVHRLTWGALINRLITHSRSTGNEEHRHYLDERRIRFLAVLPRSDLTP